MKCLIYNMFNQFLQIADNVINNAKNSTHVVAKGLLPIHSIIEQYIKEHGLILSNVDVLLEEKNNNASSYTIYGDNIFRHANNLANIIATHTIFVLLFTNDKNKDFTITVNGIPLIQLYNIMPRIRKIVFPITVRGMFMYPPEFELLEVYRKLYLPNFASEWEAYNKIRIKLEKLLTDRTTIIGGERNKKKHRLFDANIILNWLRGRRDYVLIGDNSINVLLDKKKDKYKVQIISNSVDKFIAELENFIIQYTGFEPTINTHNANIPEEPRITKTVVSVNLKINGKQKIVHILDVFNNAEYELIPFTTYRGLSIAYPNVIKHFQLLNVWYLRTLKAFGKIHNIKHLINRIIDNISIINTIPNKLFTTEEYIGINYDVKLYKKIQGTGNEFYPYNPEQHRYLKGCYRKV